MKKHFTILASAILLAATTPSAMAAGLHGSTVAETPVAALQLKEVNSNLILELELNESQYVLLKTLYSQYQKEVSALANATQENAELEGLTNAFLAEASRILKPEQLAGYVGTTTAEAFLAESK
ncbi:hypothetical protein [Pontibacter beigongshangensis]|uniref:hypothetical protein n=1 Tax=Pontibacter beigongshangensis TaxID=2574733 RepID=UPI00164F8834|nr:hypothetical protein [Pontibacter beigongshangensis]